MQHILGYIAYKGGKRLFFQRPDHAPYLIEQAIKKTPANAVMHKESDIVIMPARSYPECATWVTIYEVARQQVRFNRWTPAASRRIEQDHSGTERFTVDAFHFTEEEARARALAFADRHNYRLI